MSDIMFEEAQELEGFKENLRKAIQEENSDKVNQLVSNFVETLSGATHGDSRHNVLNNTLVDVISICDFGVIDSLIDHGADINYTYCLKQSILEKLSFGKCHDERVVHLINKGANINHRNAAGQSDFMNFVSKNSLTNKTVIQLLDLVEDIDEKFLLTGGSYLHIAVQNEYQDHKVDLLKLLLEKGLSIDDTDYNDDVPLHIATRQACWDSITFLIESGANVHARNRNNETIIHGLAWACGSTDFGKCLKLLLSKGLDINATNIKGQTILHLILADEAIDCATVELLISHGLRVNVADTMGRNELFYALMNIDFRFLDKDKRADVIKYLVYSSVDINKSDIHGRTPLHLATHLNALELLVILIDLEADITKKTHTGGTLLHWSCKFYNMTHVMLWTYLDGKQDLNVQDMYGSTALHWAVWYRNLSAAQSLLQCGADIDIKDVSGNTCAELATKLDFGEFHRLLETFMTLEELEISESVYEHKEGDAVSSCPLLKNIKKIDEGLDVTNYLEHLSEHAASIKRFIDKIICAPMMGLYYDIEENTKIPDIFRNLMTTVAERITAKNALFSCELKLVGSIYEGTKVNVTDEFDYLWILREFSDVFEPLESGDCPESFVKLRLKDDSRKDKLYPYLDRNNFLDCDMFLREFYKLVNQELIEVLTVDCEFKNIILTQQLREIWCTISSLEFKYFGTHVKDLNISIDVVPAFFFGHWIPKEFETYKISRYLKPEEAQFSVVCKTPERFNVKDFTLFFRVSFAYLEQSILKRVPVHIRKGYIVLKALSDVGYIPKVWRRRGDSVLQSSYITSYHFKTCALHAMDEFQSIPTATEEEYKIAIQFSQTIVDYFEKCLSKHMLGSFFDPKKNLIGVSGLEDGVYEKQVFKDLVQVIKAVLGLYDIGDCDWEDLYRRDGVHAQQTHVVISTL